MHSPYIEVNIRQVQRTSKIKPNKCVVIIKSCYTHCFYTSRLISRIKGEIMEVDRKRESTGRGLTVR